MPPSREKSHRRLFLERTKLLACLLPCSIPLLTIPRGRLFRNRRFPTTTASGRGSSFVSPYLLQLLLLPVLLTVVLLFCAAGAV